MGWGGRGLPTFYFAKNIQNKTNLLSSTLTDVSIILKRANDWRSCVPRWAWFPLAESVSLHSSPQPWSSPAQPRCSAAQISVSRAGTGKGTVWAPGSLTPHLSHQPVI